MRDPGWVSGRGHIDARLIGRRIRTALGEDREQVPASLDRPAAGCAHEWIDLCTRCGTQRTRPRPAPDIRDHPPGCDCPTCVELDRQW